MTDKQNTSFLIICVNYNSYDVLYKYIASIENARIYSPDIKVDVLIADNTTSNPQDIVVGGNLDYVRVFPFHKNYGYFGGITKVLESISQDMINSYDFIILSNVDLSLRPSFFYDISQCMNDNVGWLAPSIIRSSDGSDENPFLMHRPSRLKMKCLYWMYSVPMLYGIYSYISMHSRKKKAKYCKEVDLYAGMGSIIILKSSVVVENYPLSFRPFMYGEEVFIAELVRQMHLQTRYFPSVIVDDICGVSTRFLGIKGKCKMCKESFGYLIKEFF